VKQGTPGAADANFPLPFVGNIFSVVQRPGADAPTKAINPLVTAQVAALTLQANNCRTMASALRDWCNFLERRLEADAAFAEKFVTLRNPQDFALACTEYWRVALADYQTEFASIAKCTRRATDNAVDTMQDASVDHSAGAVMGE